MSSKSLHPIDLSQCQIVNPSITAPRISTNLVTDSHLLGWLRCQRRLRLNNDGHVAIFGKTLLLSAQLHRQPFHEDQLHWVLTSCVMSLLWFDWCDELPSFEDIHFPLWRQRILWNLNVNFLVKCKFWETLTHPGCDFEQWWAFWGTFRDY